MSGEWHHFVFPTGCVPVWPSAALFRTFKEQALLPPNLYTASERKLLASWGGVFLCCAVELRPAGGEVFTRGDYVTTPIHPLLFPPTFPATDPFSVSLMLPLMRGLPAKLHSLHRGGRTYVGDLTSRSRGKQRELAEQRRRLKKRTSRSRLLSGSRPPGSHH